MKESKTFLTVYGPTNLLERFELNESKSIRSGLVELRMKQKKYAELKDSWSSSLEVEKKQGLIRASWDTTTACHEFTHRMAREFVEGLFVLEIKDSEDNLLNIEVIRCNEIVYLSEEGEMCEEDLQLLKNGVLYLRDSQFPAMIGCPRCDDVVDTSHLSIVTRSRDQIQIV